MESSKSSYNFCRYVHRNLPIDSLRNGANRSIFLSLRIKLDKRTYKKKIECMSGRYRP
uniref:Uncharacterized protein n=1 Tax=Rhizophora mucronata TaxID=61149 RepID=A0A2P2QIA2_RHIMU